MILVKQQVKGSEVVEYLKTEAAFRIVDLCQELAEYLHKFVGDRKGPLFPSRKRTTPVSYGNFLKRYLTPSVKKLGFKKQGKAAHAFRRFRSSILAKSGVEEDIRKFWLGHENNDITAQYAKQIRDDYNWRLSDPTLGRLWRRRSDLDSGFRHSFRSQLSVMSVRYRQAVKAVVVS